MSGALMDYAEIRRGLVDQGVPEAAAERAAADEIARRVANTGLERTPIWLPDLPSSRENGAQAPENRVQSQSRTLVHVGSDRFAICKATIERERDVVKATFELPPRTSKNSRRFLFKHSEAYARYKTAIAEAVGESKKELHLPLPDQPYNLEAVFYVDSPGERADLFGLLQGLADALQDAGVVTDDWYFRTVDRSRIVTGDEHPRAQLIITPTEG